MEQVKINFGKENEQSLKKITIEDANKYIKQDEFAKGSMLPKVEACIYFLKHSNNKRAIITSLEKAVEAIKGNTGTTIIEGGE